MYPPLITHALVTAMQEDRLRGASAAREAAAARRAGRAPRARRNRARRRLWARLRTTVADAP